MDWDRIRIFLEVARTGQILGAARRLGVNHATVARQLTALEQELKTQLRPDKRRRGPRCRSGAG
jgi:DNA-binding transcriptional LysR family regulator